MVVVKVTAMEVAPGVALAAVKAAAALGAGARVVGAMGLGTRECQGKL